MDSKIKEYLLKDGAGIGPCMDAKAHNGYVYAIQKKNDVHNGRLCVVSAGQELVAFYDGIGSTRQLEILGDTAFVTAREDGLWILDISACEPKLICHYQSVEFATGLALCGNLAFISCRQFGVEIIDISDLTHPKQGSIIRVGEEGVYVASADCKNQNCVRHGPLRRGGTPIVCLPERIVVRWMADDTLDAVTG